MVEKLHRLFLEVLKFNLNKSGIKDINNVEALILYNIGDQKLTVGALTMYGCYLGSNVSYNLRKMCENGYVFQYPSSNDRRSSEVMLTDKGKELYEKLGEIFERQSINLQENDISEEMIRTLFETLKKIEKCITKDMA